MDNRRIIRQLFYVYYQDTDIQTLLSTSVQRNDSDVPCATDPTHGKRCAKMFFFSNEQNVSLRSSRSSFHRCSLQLPVKQSEEESWKLDETRPSKVAATIHLALHVSVTFDALSSTKKKGTSLSVMCGTFLFSSLFVVVFFFLCAHFGK